MILRALYLEYVRADSSVPQVRGPDGVNWKFYREGLAPLDDLRQGGGRRCRDVEAFLKELFSVVVKGHAARGAQ